MPPEPSVVPEVALPDIPSEASGAISGTEWLKEAQALSSATQKQALEENGSIINMRQVWGYTVLGLICAIIIFDMSLVILNGLGLLIFEDSRIVLAVIVDSFLKIFGLGLLITKRIFDKIYPNNSVPSKT